jgi:2-iminobutanoate/2-iminopropanoate deaminase
MGYHVPMPRETISSDHAPKAIGPYSQAIAVDLAPAAGARMIFCSGQIPLDPATGELVGSGDVRLQAERVLLNLKAVLVAAGAALPQVVKTTIYLADMQDFAAVNEVYARYFPNQPPARATVQAAGLPRGAMVEIDAIAIAIS